MSDQLSLAIDIFLALYTTAALLMSVFAYYLRETDSYVGPDSLKGFLRWIAKKLHLL